jgi:diguanylate cyclase (GGDEF)-like protein/PAS domain S-box-containing protein
MGDLALYPEMTTAIPHLRPTDEACRLETLSRYDILDTPPEGEFDEVVALAAHLCEAPISTITLIDEHRQWFKAKVGLVLEQTSRDLAFCSHTVLQHEPLIITDARLDPRFADNPLVLHAPHLVFYAGFPLLPADGYAVGTLMVMDKVPRTLTPDQISTMQVLAHQVVARLELRGSLQQLKQAQAGLTRAKLELETQVEERTRELVQATAAQVHAERLYHSLWETTTDVILVLDTHSIIRYANPSTQSVFGHPPEQLVGKPVTLLQPERMRQAHQQGLRRYLDSGVKRLDWRATESIGLRADGSEVPIEIAFSELTLDGQHHFVGFIRDITLRKRAEIALFEEKERAQTTLRSIGDAVVTTDHVGRIAFLNPMAERLTGWTHAEACGRSYDEILQLTDEATGERLTIHGGLAAESSEAQTVMPTTTLLQRRTGGSLSVEGSIAQLVNRQNAFAGWVIAFRDVSLSRSMAAQISYQASHDTLTGLVNRTEFDRQLHAALDSAAVQHRQHSMLYLDLDQFKVVNDTRGHIAGDELLKQLSTMLASNLRSSDTLARLGGDEFGVLLENCAPGPALQIAEKLRRVIADFTFVWEDRLFTTTVSIGHVHFDDHTLTLTDILSRADEACYVAKDHGRNRIHTYQPGDEALVQRHGEMEWIGLIHKAIEENRLVLYAQPIFAVGDIAQPATHLEILLRMRDPDGQLVPPMAFIPAAERYNLMPTIDRWVIRAVFSHIAERQRAEADLGECWYAVNLSGASLGDPAFSDYIQAELIETGIPPAWICFEITETTAIANLTSAAKFMREVKNLGCRFSLDDFGSGMSSFSYLKHLPVDFLKIDGSFVQDITTDPIDRAMVVSINEIGHLMGLQTIAEFVENDSILQELRNIGVDYAQGYGLARPAPLL